MNLIIGTIINWDAIGAISSAIASIAAFMTIFISIKNDRENSKDQQFAVQPWFHVTQTSRMGVNAAVNLILLNDASPNIKITNVKMKVKDWEDYIEIKYRYLKKGDGFIETGKCFELIIENDPNLFGKSAFIEISFSNLYKRSMKSISPDFIFNPKIDDNTLLNIITKDFLFIPFSNEINE